MPLPDNFDPAEHLQDVFMQVQNKIVKQEFSDIAGDGWTLNIGSPRASLLTACLHTETDSLAMTQLRNDLYYMVLRKASDLHPAIYGIPSMDFQAKMTFYPQVELYFEEKLSEVEKGYDPISAQVKFRLVGEKAETYSKSEAIALANKIKANLGSATAPFSFKKGRELFTYKDQEHGYFFQLYVFSEAEAKKVITEVMQLRGHAPVWKLLTAHISDQPATAFPIVPPNKTILGKSVKQPRRRPVGTVRYRYSLVYLDGLAHPLVLHDLSNSKMRPLVK